jgi:hypothetical protein
MQHTPKIRFEWLDVFTGSAAIVAPPPQGIIDVVENICPTVHIYACPMFLRETLRVELTEQ